MGQYTVYKHTTPCGKVYIGITSQKPEARWLNGHGYDSQTYFHRAILKYGWKNIEHTIIAEGLTKEQAQQMEIDMISQYKSADRRYGYNCSLGGELGNAGHSRFTDTIIQAQFKCLGIENGKLILECLECGRIFKRGSGVTSASSHIKCECMKITKRKEPKKYHFIEINGEVHTVAEWSRILDIPVETIRDREKRGLDIIKGKQPTLTPCAYCGKPFHKAKPSRKYCSTECQHNAMRGPKKARPTATCKMCGKVFEVGRDRKGIYCSRECQHKSMKKVDE